MTQKELETHPFMVCLHTAVESWGRRRLFVGRRSMSWLRQLGEGTSFRLSWGLTGAGEENEI